MLNEIRKSIFWSIDKIKGGRVEKEYKDIELTLENLNSKLSIDGQTKNLENLLKHAVSTTPYYSKYEKSLDLSDYPVVNKNIIIDNYEDFKSKSFLNKSNYSAYTSGSTGTPFRIYHNAHKKFRNTADVIYFAKISGFEIGDELYYIRHWDQYNSMSSFEAWKRNIHMHPVSKLTEGDVKGLLEDMQKNKSRKGIIAYASALNEIRDYILKHNLKPEKNSAVKSIIAMSETLVDSTKQVLGDYFGVKVLSRYSNVENGIIAQQYSKDSKDFTINWASYHVELLNLETDAPAKYGELGRIVITDLFNYCMPMIRYDTGDIGILKEGEIPNYPVLTEIEGRKSDLIYNAKGEHVSSYAVYNILKYPHIKQYQFIQEGDKDYRFKLNVEKDFNSENDIRNEFLNVLGEDAQIEFTYVKEIPLLASGKRKFVTNRNKKKEKQA